MTTNKAEKPQDSAFVRLLRSPFFVAASGVGVIGMAFAIDSLRDYISPGGVAVATGAVFFFVMMNMVINAVVSKMHNQDYFDSRLEVLNNIILNNNLNWLVNQKYVQMLEMQADEIWAFAPELTYAIQPDSEIFKAVQQTLARGSKYRIFMPNRPETHKIIADYRRLHVFKPGQVEFILVPHEEYVFHTIISVYNPHSEAPKAIEWLPVEDLVAWLEMDRMHASRMVGIGEVLQKRYMQQNAGPDSVVKEIPRAQGRAIIE